MLIVERSRSSAYSGTSVLVTGADGFIGSHLTEQLAAAGSRLTALAQYNSFDSHGWLDELPPDVLAGVRVVRGDVRDGAFVGRLVAGHEVVFHLAALIAIPHSYAAAQSYVDTNIVGTLNVLEAGRAHNVRRIVQTSTSEVYGSARTVPISEAHPLQGQSPYAASKIGADMMAQAYARSFDLPVVILRPFNTYGPRQSERAVIPTILRQVLDSGVGIVKIGDVTTRRDFTYVEDTATAFMAAGSCDGLEYGKAYNAGSGRSVTVGDLIEIIMTLTGSRKPVQQEADRLRPPNSEVRELLADSSRFLEATGWQPRVSLRDGLARTMECWRDRLARGEVRRETSYAI